MSHHFGFFATALLATLLAACGPGPADVSQVPEPPRTTKTDVPPVTHPEPVCRTYRCAR